MTAAVLQRAPLLGRTTPRLYTPELRPLTRATTRGYEVADFAEHVLGRPLLPWQKELAVRALEVDAAGRFRFRVVIGICGRQNGKTELLRVISLWRLYVDRARLVVGAAQDLAVARESLRELILNARAVPALSAEILRVSKTNGDEHLELESGGRYRISATSDGAGRGLSVDLLILDELRQHKDWRAWSALSKTTMARSHGQTWAISSAGDASSAVLNNLREAALSGRDPSIGLFEWSAPEGCDLDDVEGWCAANPGLGYTVSEAAIRTALGTDPANVFRTEVLAQWVDASQGAIDSDAWRDCADAKGALNKAGRIVAAFDVSPDGEHASLVVASPLADGRIRVEVADAWTSVGAALNELPGLLARIRPEAIAWFPTGPAAGFSTVLRGAKGSVEITGARVSESCQVLADLVTARKVLHPSDPMLDAHLCSSHRLRQGDGWRFSRYGKAHCDGAYATAAAVLLASTLPPKANPWIGAHVL